MARAYTELFITRSDAYKERYIQNKLEVFGCDGILYHNARTCPNNTNCFYFRNNGSCHDHTCCTNFYWWRYDYTNSNWHIYVDNSRKYCFSGYSGG